MILLENKSLNPTFGLDIPLYVYPCGKEGRHILNENSISYELNIINLTTRSKIK